MKNVRITVVLAFAMLWSAAGWPQDLSRKSGPAVTPAVQKDTESVDALLAALYDVISGQAAKERDWTRFRNLFAPGARLMPTGPKEGGGHGVTTASPDQYIERVRPIFAKEGFYETEIGRTTERYGNIVHAFSTYESKHDPKDVKPFMRGINSIQLMYDGQRWWVLSVLWQNETPDNPLPAKYVGKEHTLSD